MDRDSLPGGPPGAPARARAASSDDLAALRAADQAEGRLRVAAAELERVKRETAEAEERQRLSVITAPAPVTKSDPPESKAFRASGKGWKVVLPIGLVTAVITPVVAAGQHFLELERTVSAQTQAIKGYQASLDDQNDEIKLQGQRITELTGTVARLSGFLAGAFPKLGLQVTAEAGATVVDVKADPLPPSSPRRTQVRVTTPVPAPKPR